jgi:putative spermidine/putrescine transport system ATP-binding protein
MAELEIQKLHKRFGDFVALKSLDLKIVSGEFLSFLGPSGCGKTTALRIIAGFERPTTGRVLVGGKDILPVPANRRDMGMVFQAYSLFPNMTALDNVAFGLRVRKVSRAERSKKAADLLELVGLGAMAGRYPHQMSGGQQQRVALARALAIQPSVLLLDEPLSALDAKVRVQLRGEIRRIQSQLGITTLYVTHDQEEALSISDRVVVLSQGRIEQVGTPTEIYGDPSTVFVAQFVGTMNRIEGTIASNGAGLVECGGASLRVDVASGRRLGERVLVLIRPEAVTISEAGAPVEGAIPGRVITRIFLGSTTRISVQSAVGEVQADVGSLRALQVADRAEVLLTWNPAAPRLISLDVDSSNDESPSATRSGSATDPREFVSTGKA